MAIRAGVSEGREVAVRASGEGLADVVASARRAAQPEADDSEISHQARRDEDGRRVLVRRRPRSP